MKTHNLQKQLDSMIVAWEEAQAVLLLCGIGTDSWGIFDWRQLLLLGARSSFRPRHTDNSNGRTSQSPTYSSARQARSALTT